MLSDLIQYFTNISNISNISSKNINNSNKSNIYYTLINNKLDPVPKFLDFVHRNTLDQNIKTAIEIGIDRNRDLFLDYASFGFDNYYSLNMHYCDTFEVSDDTNFILKSLFSTFDKDVKVFHGTYTIDTFIEVDENEQEYDLNKFTNLEDIYYENTEKINKKSNVLDLLNKEMKAKLQGIAINNKIDTYNNPICELMFSSIEFSPKIDKVIKELLKTNYNIAKAFDELGILYKNHCFYTSSIADLECDLAYDQININYVLLGIIELIDELKNRKIIKETENINDNQNIQKIKKIKKNNDDFLNNMEKLNNELLDDYGSAYSYYSLSPIQIINNEISRLHAPIKEDIIL